MNAPATTAQTSVAEIRQPGSTSANALMQQNHEADLMTMQGFALVQRIANAFASSDAVPAAFRSHIEKRSGSNVTVIENKAAIGNCMIAIETARSIGMPVSAVMQNADIINGKLRWSGKFQIAAINASRRFTQLEFEIVNKGRISAKYKEKGAWNDNKRGFDYEEREVQVDNVECVAFAHPIVNGVANTAKTVRGPKVSIKMAVEEGWYSKPDSKWRGEMQELMLIYRAGSFFGNTHAPDVLLGMGRTSEEEYDILDVDADGAVTQVTRGRGERPTKRAEGVVEVQPAQAPAPAAQAAAAPAPRAEPAAPPAAAPAQEQQRAVNVEAFAQRLEKCDDIEALRVLADEIRDLGVDEDTEGRLYATYRRRERELREPRERATPPAQAAAPSPAPRARTQRSID